MPPTREIGLSHLVRSRNKSSSSNTGEKVGDCPILESMEVFQLREDIVLTERLPAITSNFAIDGNGNTISGDKRFRIFDSRWRQTYSRFPNLTHDGRESRIGQRDFRRSRAQQFTWNHSSVKTKCCDIQRRYILRDTVSFTSIIAKSSWNIADTGAAIYSPLPATSRSRLADSREMARAKVAQFIITWVAVRSRIASSTTIRRAKTGAQ